ncbi:hypothetical protein H5410_011636, partial [Solanum commersonii]
LCGYHDNQSDSFFLVASYFVKTYSGGTEYVQEMDLNFLRNNDIYSNDNQNLWGSVIKAKYEESDNWMTKEVTTLYGASLWKSIYGMNSNQTPRLMKRLSLFIQCKVIGQLWTILRLKTSCGSCLVEWQGALYSREVAGLQAKNRSNWRIIPATIWWTIWKERNLRSFWEKGE